MKKAKIMLFALVTLTTIGGAYAFKAKTFSGKRYCTAASSESFCPNQVTNVQFGTQTGTTVKYIEVTGTGTQCSTSLACSNTGVQETED